MICRRTGKVIHKTIKGAKIALKIAAREWDDDGLSWYRCRKCGAYHIGHMSPRRARKVQAQRLAKFIQHCHRQNGRGR